VTAVVAQSAVGLAVIGVIGAVVTVAVFGFGQCFGSFYRLKLI
jgi:hypothetical protein